MYINRGFAHYKSASHPAGFDKIALHSKDFEVKDILPFAIAPNYKKQGEAETQESPLFLCSGNQIYGSKAFHNAGDEMGNLSINIDWRGCGMSWNPSKLLGKKIGSLASPQDVQNGVNIIQDYLTTIGLSTNLSSYKISRIDLAKDREMTDKVFTYHQALQMIDGKRMKEAVQYPDGFRIGNQSRQSIFYDKGLEIEPKAGATNNMRCEMRLLKSDAVQKVMNISHVHQVHNLQTQDVSKIYSGFLSNDVFRIGNYQQMSFDFMTEVSILKDFKQKGRNAFKIWMMLMGFDKAMATFGKDGIKKIMQEAGFHRNYIAQPPLIR